MKNDKGVATPILLIFVVIIIIAVFICTKYIKKMVNEAHLRDLRTDMLVIQADSKKGLEEICFQTANLDKNKEEDIAKINEVKKENIKGTPVKGTEIEELIPEGIDLDENFYYLNEDILKDIGVKEIETEKYGCYIVKYDFDNIKIEVINTDGYEGKYTLTQLLEEE